MSHQEVEERGGEDGVPHQPNNLRAWESHLIALGVGIQLEVQVEVQPEVQTKGGE